MQARLLTAALLGAFIIPTLSITAQKRKATKQSHNESNQWYVFVGPDGDFKIAFPEKPNREPDGQGPVTAVQSYGLYTQNRMRFSVNFTGAAGDPDSRLNNEWNDDYERDLSAIRCEPQNRPSGTASHNGYGFTTDSPCSTSSSKASSFRSKSVRLPCSACRSCIN